jgi:hypothetical protein
MKTEYPLSEVSDFCTGKVLAGWKRQNGSFIANSKREIAK